MCQHKALNLQTPHLAAIKLPRPPPPLHSTRVAPHRHEQVIVPFSRTDLLWNQLVHQTDLHHRSTHASLQDFKRGVNSGRSSSLPLAQKRDRSPVEAYSDGSTIRLTCVVTPTTTTWARQRFRPPT
ncbi:hypothetical protein GWK47_049990 [Chionoecetes opilio]|uniref:Uncharacterized protein n=1 Tax=Chionoecetes opilio TaxID=41210 RepID=A0A8J4Y9I7_CHIOP|nr:hypothetical protein GWK47_049990 [Chionoecetes opilio]